ncbi:MAG: T9SS type A sorting domain-containing protein, partial [Bacteroidota bacterium]
SEFALQAEVIDQEDNEEQLQYAWQTFLHHNTHNHPEAIDPRPQSSMLVLGEGCGEEVYWYRVALTVTDRGGLSATEEVNLFPHCEEPGVRFESITASQVETRVRVEWKVEEIDSGIYYVVERSPDQRHYQALREIKASGQSEYAIEDHGATDGRWYYRIRANERNDFYSFSPLALIEVSNSPAMRVYPNPVSDELVLSFKQIYGAASFALYDLQGETVFAERWIEATKPAEKRLILDHLAAGMYLYRLEDGNEVQFGKLMLRTD